MLLARNYAHPKQDLQGAVELVERERRPDDATTSVGLASRPIHDYFAPRWPVTETAADLDRLLAGGRTVWLVTAFEGHTRATQADVMREVDRRFDKVAELPGTMGGGTVRVYRSRPVGPGR